jgi:nucleotide-binding universal stress UspA family protein
MIVLCYDGSADAQAAADHVVRLFAHKAVTVVTVMESYIQMLAASGLGLGSGFGLDSESSEDAAAAMAELQDQAGQTADEGARRLRAAGVDAASLVAPREGSIGEAILAVAERKSADAVVVGTRGRGAAKATLLGSVSQELLQHADRPVVVVPSPAVAHRREARGAASRQRASR